MLEFAALWEPWPFASPGSQRKMLEEVPLHRWRRWKWPSGSFSTPYDAALGLEDPLGGLRASERFAWVRLPADGPWDRGNVDARLAAILDTPQGPVRAYAATSPSRCTSEAGECNDPATFLVRATGPAVVLLLDLRYIPGRSVAAKAFTLAGQDVGQEIFDCAGGARIEDVDSSLLVHLAQAWAIKAGLLRSWLQDFHLLFQERKLKPWAPIVFWCEAAERRPPRRRLPGKINLQGLRWQRFMEALATLASDQEMPLRPEDFA